MRSEIESIVQEANQRGIVLFKIRILFIFDACGKLFVEVFERISEKVVILE